MRNIYYTYHMVNEIRPTDVYACHTIKDVMRTRIQGIKTEKQRTPLKPHGVIVFMPDGSTLKFKSQRKCSEELGLSESTIRRYIKNGNSDSKGRFYDYPA